MIVLKIMNHSIYLLYYCYFIIYYYFDVNYFVSLSLRINHQQVCLFHFEIKILNSLNVVIILIFPFMFYAYVLTNLILQFLYQLLNSIIFY